MSKLNIDIVRSIYARWEQGDYSWTDLQHPNCEFVMADGPNPGRWVGADGIGEGWGDFLGAWEDFRHQAGEYRDLSNERVLVLFHFSGRGKRSGVEVEQMQSKAAGLFQLHEGKVTRIVLHFDRSEALKAVGQSE